MPTNVIFGNTAQFVAEFLDADGLLTVPSGGTLTIDYPTSNTTSTSTSITMTLQNSYFTATWYSSVSALGTAGWSITATGSTTAASTGVLRIITP